MLTFERALSELEALDQVQAELFSMRFPLGCSAEETARLSGLSKATVDRKVKLARAWLFQRFHDSKGGESKAGPLRACLSKLFFMTPKDEWRRIQEVYAELESLFANRNWKKSSLG